MSIVEVLLNKVLEKELQQLGLSGKEAKTYLVSLELGPTSVWEISKKAGLRRPTTYFNIDSLIKKGLMSSFEKGKKRYFSAESPERLISLITVQRRKAQALEEDLQRALPELNKIFDLVGERSRVRFFEGKEGIKAIQEDILRAKFNSLEEFVPLDEAYRIFPPSPQDHRHKMDKKLKKIPRRTIYSSEKKKLLEKEGLTERRYIDPKKSPFSTEIVIYGNKVSCINYKGKLIGIIIESEEIVNSLRVMFDFAWETVGKSQG